MYGIAVSPGPAVMRFFILLAKTALGKKRPFIVLWYCSFARARGRIFKWEGGGELMRNFKLKSSEMGINASKTANSNIKL